MVSAGRRPSATAIAFAPSGLSVAVGDAEGGIRLLDVLRGTDTEMGRHGAAIYRMAFAPDGRLFTASQDGRITVHETDAPGRRLSRMELPAGLVDLQVSPDGKHLAALLARGEATSRMPRSTPAASPSCSTAMCGRTTRCA